MPLTVILPDGTVERPELGSGDPVDSFAQELTVGGRGSRLGSRGRQALRQPWPGRPCDSAWRKSKASKVAG